MAENDLQERLLVFAVRVVSLFRVMQESPEGRIISNQLLRSGTSIGANYEEAQEAQSKPDFISKVSIALKEASETRYWLRLVAEIGPVPSQRLELLTQECAELIKILGAIVHRAKQ